MNLLVTLKTPRFNKLCCAQLFSDLAAWLDVSVVVVYMVYYWGVGAYTQAGYFITIALACICGSLISAMIADYFFPKKILIICNIFRVIILLLYCTAGSSLMLLLYVFIKTVFSAIYDPVTQVIIRYTFEDNELPAANSISSVITQLMKILAPLFGGGLLLLLKPIYIFIVCSSFYMLSTLFLCMLPIYKDQKKSNEKKSQLGLPNIFYSLKFILNNSRLLLAMIMVCSFTLAIFVCESFYVMLFKQLLLPETSVGMLFSTVGVGGIIGSLLAGWLVNKLPQLTTICLNGIIMGFFILIIFFYAIQWIHFSWVGFIFTSFIFGISSSFFTVAFATLLQKETPHMLIGSVSSIANGLQMVFIVIGPLLGSFLVVHYGLGATFFISGLLCIFISIGILPFSTVFDRSLDQEPIQEYSSN